MSATDSIVAGKHTQLEYTIGGNQVWYDISFVDCAVGDSASNCPGHDGGIKITGSVGECAEMHCEAGSYCVTKAYYVDQPKIKLGVEEPVGTCAGAGTGVDIVFDICSDSPGTNGGLGRRGVAGRVKL